jgi:hypothetical protein
MGIIYSTENTIIPDAIQPETKIQDEVENYAPFIKSPAPSPALAPAPLTKDSIVNSVISQFVKRSNVGLEKYGTNLDRTDLSLLDWVQHTQEEMMDGILYLEKIKKSIPEAS